jgi:putative membrane protein
MRTILSTCLVALTLSTLGLACANSNDPQPAKDPIGAQLNQTQTPTTNPTPQSPNDPFARNGESHTPREPRTNPTPQEPIMDTPSSPAALTDPAPQKPFYLGGEGSGGNKVLAKTEKPLSDAEVLGVVLTANDGEVMMADQAIKKATSKDAKDFAMMMKTHHSQGLTKTKSIATKTKIGTADSDVTSFLKSDTDKTIKDLRDNKEGHDFDVAYIDAQLAAHKAVLAAIDNRLVPSAQNADVKSLVNETRRTVADHIAKAEDVQKKLQATASTDEMKKTEPTTTTKAKAKTEKAKTDVKGKTETTKPEKGINPRP